MNRPGNPLGLGLLIVGATAVAIAAFLPLDEPTGVFRAVEHNTLIQRGGWMLIALAIGIAASGFWANQRTGNWLALPIVLCVVAAWGIFNLATNKNLRTLYPVKADGSLDTSQPGVVVPLGIAIYLAGVGVAVALIGSVMLAQTGRRPAPGPHRPDGARFGQAVMREHRGHELFYVPPEIFPQAVDGPAAADGRTKKCPDCAETILADAKVCKHCGYRFAASARDAPQELGPWAPGTSPAPDSPNKPAAPLPAHPTPTPQGSRAPQLVFAALAVLAVVGFAIYFVTKDSNNRTHTTTTSTTPPVAAAALDGLLLDPSAIDTATGTTGITSDGRHAMTNAAVTAVSPPGCRAPVTEEANSYAGSGWTASQEEELEDPAKPGVVAQAVVLFPSAQAAASFFSASVSQWSACAHQTIFATHKDGKTVKSATGPVSSTNGILSITITSSSLTYQHALTSTNNVVIDVLVSGSTGGRYVGDEAVHIASEIAAKVPK